MKLTNEILKKIVLIRNKTSLEYPEIKNDLRAIEILEYYFLSMSEYDFKKKTKNKKLILETDNLYHYIK